MYARIRYRDGRESNVSLRDLARCPNENDKMVNYRGGLVPSGGSMTDPIETNTPKVMEGNRNQSVDREQDKANDSEINEAHNIEPETINDDELVNSNSTSENVQHLIPPSISRTTSEDSSGNQVTPRRSNRVNKGVPPSTFGDWIE